MLEISPFGALRSILALKGNVARNEYYFLEITSISAFRRSNRGGRTCSTSLLRDLSSIANLILEIF
jgi:hypothetical protein